MNAVNLASEGCFKTDISAGARGLDEERRTTICIETRAVQRSSGEPPTDCSLFSVNSTIDCILPDQVALAEATSDFGRARQHLNSYGPVRVHS